MLINLHDTEEGKRTFAHYFQFDLLNHDSVLGPSKKNDSKRENTSVKNLAVWATRERVAETQEYLASLHLSIIHQTLTIPISIQQGGSMQDLASFLSLSLACKFSSDSRGSMGRTEKNWISVTNEHGFMDFTRDYNKNRAQNECPCNVTLQMLNKPWIYKI